MIASKLVKLVKAHKGKLYAPVHSTHGTMHVVVEKQYLIDLLTQHGDFDSGYELITMDDGTTAIDACN